MTGLQEVLTTSDYKNKAKNKAKNKVKNKVKRYSLNIL